MAALCDYLCGSAHGRARRPAPVSTACWRCCSNCSSPGRSSDEDSGAELPVPSRAEPRPPAAVPGRTGRCAPSRSPSWPPPAACRQPPEPPHPAAVRDRAGRHGRAAETHAGGHAAAAQQPPRPRSRPGLRLRRPAALLQTLPARLRATATRLPAAPRSGPAGTSTAAAYARWPTAFSRTADAPVRAALTRPEPGQAHPHGREIPGPRQAGVTVTPVRSTRSSPATRTSPTRRTVPVRPGSTQDDATRSSTSPGSTIHSRERPTNARRSAGHGELDLRRGARAELDPRPAEQLGHGPGDRRDQVPGVQLDDVRAGARPGVADGAAHLDLAVDRRRLGRHHKVGVREPV